MPAPFWDRSFACEGVEVPSDPTLEVILAADRLIRNGIKVLDGVKQPAPAPRFSRTPAEVRSPPPVANEPDVAALAAWGFVAVAIDALRAAGVLA